MSVYHYDNARVVRRLLGFILIVIGVVLMTVLYYVKIRAQSAKVDRANLSVQIEREQLALNVLRAEIAHLESPERLSHLSKAQIGLIPTPVDRIITISDIQDRIPIREENVSESVRSQRSEPKRESEAP